MANDYVEEVLGCSDNFERIGSIRFRWAVGTPWHTTRPDEARGLRVRLHRVGVGHRQYFDLGVAGRTFSRLNWLTGEVNIVSGMDQAIAVDRDSFTQSRDYDEFRDFFRSKLRELAFFVEDVDEVRRKITAQISQSPRAAVAPTGDVVSTQVKRLEKRGFRVVEKRNEMPRREPVVIDTEKRTVTIDTAIAKRPEVVLVGRQQWNVEYGSWSVSQNTDDAYRILGGKTIRLNQNYPLFKGSYKDLFRRLQIVIAHAEHSSASKGEFLGLLQRALLEQFSGARK